MDKNEELYKYSKDVLDEEFQRFKKIDDKATRYLSILTAIIGIYALLGRLTFANLIPPENIVQGVTLVLGISVLAALLYSWYLLFKAVRLHEVKKPPLTDEVFNYFNGNDTSDILYGLAWNNKLAFETNRKTSDEKTKILSKGYRSIAIAVSLLVLFVISSGINEWYSDATTLKQEVITNGEITMPENDTTKADEVKEEPKTPEPDVAPPELDTVRESYDPNKKE